MNSPRKNALNCQQSFLVQAPAGSGKTELLIQRYLNLLLDPALQQPEEILAITFTRKAAAEMQERLISALKMPTPNAPHQHITWELAQAVKARDKQLNWQLLTNPNRLQLNTIDAFTARLCQQLPILSRLSGQPCEDATPLYQQAIRHMLQQFDGPYHAPLTTLLQHLGNRVEQLESLLIQLARNRDQWLPHIIPYRHQNARAELEAGLERIVADTLEQLITTVPQLNTLETLLTYAKKNLPPEHPWHTSNNELTHYQHIAELCLTQKGHYRTTITKRHGFPAGSPQKAVLLATLADLTEHVPATHFQAVLDCPPPHYSNAQWHIIAALIELLPWLIAELQLVFHSQVDFTELSLGALRAFGDSHNPSELALQLDYKMRHILVDEFQDTSLTQFNLLEKLIAGWEPNDGRTLFLVGDPMQSIYRFRNAEVGLFIRAKQHGINHIPLTFLQLTQNFRSSTSLVDWFNTTFPHVFPTFADITLGAIPYSPVEATQTTPGAVNITLTDQTDALIRDIKNTLREHPDDSLALLVRSRAQLSAILPALADIPYHAEAIQPLRYHIDIRDMLSLTRAFTQINDRLAWFSLLHSPLVGLSLATLLELSETDTTLLFALPEKHPKTTQLHQCLQQGYQQPLRQWLQTSWQRLGGHSPYEGEFFNLLENFGTTLFDFDFSSFEASLSKRFASSNNPTARLQIMTIHKSKGLEFDHVFIPHLESKTPPNNPQLLKWLERPRLDAGSDLILASLSTIPDPVYRYVSNIEKQKRNLENARLFYVAVTRAKKTLHLYGDEEKSISHTSFLHFIRG